MLCLDPQRDSAIMEKIPSTFCWSKMGVESGERLAAIICRKEWERRLGNGYFFWGIGQSLGKKINFVTSETSILKAIFSPMLSKARSIDSSPGSVVFWNAWVDSTGRTRPLPVHSFITSRAFLPSGKRKRSHFALVCFSDQELNKQNHTLSVSSNYLRNVKTNKPLGSSQVTAIVNTIAQEEEFTRSKRYTVSFTAELRQPCCIQLAQPIFLDADDLNEIQSITDSGDIELWSALVRSRRSRQVEEDDWIQGTLDFGDEINLSISDNLPLSMKQYALEKGL